MHVMKESTAKFLKWLHSFRRNRQSLDDIIAESVHRLHVHSRWILVHDSGYSVSPADLQDHMASRIEMLFRYWGLFAALYHRQAMTGFQRALQSVSNLECACISHKTVCHRSQVGEDPGRENFETNCCACNAVTWICFRNKWRQKRFSSIVRGMSFPDIYGWLLSFANA